MSSLSNKQSIPLRETIQNAFLFRIMPLRLFILYQAPLSQALTSTCDARVTVCYYYAPFNEVGYIALQMSVGQSVGRPVDLTLCG